MVSMETQAALARAGLKAAFDAFQRGPEASTGESVFRALRQAIVTMTLSPGARLTEQELADALSISRQPAREALLRLREARLVRVAPRGWFVARISIADVETAQFVREAIELAIVRRAAEGVQPHEAGLLREILRRQTAAAKAGDGAAFFALDEEFHRTLAAAADCAPAWRVIEMAKAHMDRVRFLSTPSTTPMERLIAQHRAVLKGVIARDQDAAADAMRTHLREIIVSLPLLATRNAQLFEDAGAPPGRPAHARPRIEGDGAAAL